MPERESQTHQPRVTVVVATRDRREELHRTLRHLATARPTPPVIVVDNASSDGTTEDTRDAFREVTLITLPENRACAARNVGVAAAETPYVAFSDDDSWWAEDALDLAANLFDTHPRLGLIAATTLVGPERRPDPVNNRLAQGLGVAGPPGPRVLGFLACAAVVRKQAFTDAGGFNQLLFFVGEESLLAQDIAAAGWELRHVPEIHAYHHPSAHRPPNAWRRRLERRNRVLAHWMRRPVGRATRETARLVRDAVTVPDASAALRDVVRDAPQALRHRHRLPHHVERDLRALERQ